MNPGQVKAIDEMYSPKNKKDVQRLTGHLEAFNKFISNVQVSVHLFLN